MSEKVTAQQVARRAGVSQSAVSRVFTPGASVSEKMATRVREAAEELGYRPNILARAMVSGRSRIVGFVVAYLDNYFYPEAIEKLSNAMQKRGYHLLMFMASQTTGSIDDVVDEILDYQIAEDGLLPNLLAFNVGVEIGQLLALGAILIVMGYWRRSASFKLHAYNMNVLMMCAGFVLIGYQLTGYFVA